MAVVLARNEPTSIEMDPMHATIQDHPSTSQSPLPCDVSNRDTATSETAQLNPCNPPEREAPAQSGYPSTRLDADNSIYGKGPADCRRGVCWASLVLSVVACAFAVPALIVTLAGGRPNTTEQVRGWESRLQFNFAASSVWP